MRLRQLETIEIVYFILCKVIQGIISLYLTVVIILPVCSISWLVNELVRKYISLRLKSKYGTACTLVDSPEDNVWSFKKPGNSRNNLIFTVYTDAINPNLEKYRETFSKRVFQYLDERGTKPYEKLCKIFTVKYGYCCWKVDKSFDVGNHVKVFQKKLTMNNHHTNSTDLVLESDLAEILSGLAKDMPEEHPQWEEIIIPRFAYSKDVIVNDGTCGAGESLLKPEGKFHSAKIFRFHHAYMDCLSALTLMKTCMIDSDEDFHSKSSRDPFAPLHVSLSEKAFQLLNLITFGATKLIRNIFNEAITDSRYSMTRYTGKTHHAWSAPIDIKLLESIQVKTGCSTTEILTSAFGGALRSVSEHYCKKPEWLIFPDSFEESVFMGISKVILPYPSEAPMNRLTRVGLNVSTAKLESRLERLKMVREGYSEHVRGSPVPSLNYHLMSFLGRFPNWVIQRLIAETGAPVIFSNNPRILRRISLMGEELQEFAVWMPLLSQSGVGVVAAKYCDSFRLCGVSEVGCLSFNELCFLLSVMRDEIHLLGKECVAHTS